LEVALTPNTQTRSKHLLIAWLQTIQEIKQKELVAVCRVALDCKPSSSAQSCTFLVELMRTSARLGWRESFADEMEVLTEVLDQALVKTYAQMHAECMGPQEWWENFSDLAAHVMDTSAAEKILNETTSWTSVAAELEQVCTSSQVGLKIFGHAQVKVLNAVFGQAPSTQKPSKPHPYYTSTYYT